jgi:hypothetical protein
MANRPRRRLCCRFSTRLFQIYQKTYTIFYCDWNNKDDEFNRTRMTVVLQALRKSQIVILENEFRIIRDDDFFRIDVDGRLMVAAAIRLVFFPFLWIFTNQCDNNFKPEILLSTILLPNQLTCIIKMSWRGTHFRQRTASRRANHQPELRRKIDVTRVS